MQVQLARGLGITESPEEIFWRVYRQASIGARRKLPVTSVEVHWRNYANSISVVRVRESVLHVGLTFVLRRAPVEVLEALANLLVSKLLRRRPLEEPRTVYRGWLHAAETRKQLDEARRQKGRKMICPPPGEHFDLREVFDAVNRRYFDGAIERPRLGWSRTASRTHLGHWDPALNTIVLSRFLDTGKIGRLVVEYVMYHEILHMVHPEERDGGRRKIHTRAFKSAEMKFEGLKEARGMLKSLCTSGLSF